MVPLLVFYIHVVAITAVFTKRWQEEGLTEGFLSVFFMGLIFFVGWSISSFILKLVMNKEGWGYFLDRDAVSLLLLTAGEGVFYYFYLKDDTSRNNPTREEL
jgi:hypothetical protein